MADLKQQLKEDKAIRGAARSIVAAQIAQVRQGLSGQRIGSQLADSLGESAIDKLGKLGLPAKVIAAAGAAGVLAIALAWKPVAALLASDNEATPTEVDNDA
ncbi:hypothetical protein [Altererythrobacter sp.]|uniref:hypothetical protein n=1 Tax=Altererythrobacter sp. TaxID=1872480 RepID=UPI001B06F7A3|nr:hypothetical protein [Altererythrobacter sp.]MBO6609132.1 hypothetical protein [Altererythrobacter sp.]MBO6641341.1 hypothetical protein [Altererythrobacter sp.]MBO6707961.1 hypothetical protein [Altererythrobacter sp.]